MDCRRVNRRNPNLPAGVMMTRLIVAAALLACPFAAAGQTVGWPAYGGADGGGHYTPATQISPQNVAQLELAWTHRSGDFREGV
ncbi:MAG: hypothetical protein OXJ53_06025, partial [Gammaproteobacteria bacterium]|nr:hypothetical protein [Gammaproteobacteria bacterium]MDE0272564.1 hypothetical protein [Gammaproteobacteria bacterium]